MLRQAIVTLHVHVKILECAFFIAFVAGKLYARSVLRVVYLYARPFVFCCLWVLCVPYYARALQCAPHAAQIGTAISLLDFYCKTKTLWLNDVVRGPAITIPVTLKTTTCTHT